MTPKDRHEAAKTALLKSLRNLNPEVKSAVQKVAEMATPRHTVQSRPHSLLKLVRLNIDPAVANWLSRNNVAVQWKYSDLMIGDHGHCVALLEKLAMRGAPNDWVGSDEFSRTCDALISFLFFSAEHQSRHVKVVRLERSASMDDDEAADRIEWGPKRGVRKHGGFPVPDYLIGTFQSLQEAGLCIACGQHTLESEERQRLLHVPIDKAIKGELRRGMQYFSKERGSALYCEDHAKSTAGAAGEKKGQRQRIRFMSLLQAMTRKGMVAHLNKLFPPSFNIEFARLAIKDPGGLRDLKVIEDYLPIHFFTDDEATRTVASEKIVAAISKIFLHRLKLTPQPYDAEAGMAKYFSHVENGINVYRLPRDD